MALVRRPVKKLVGQQCEKYKYKNKKLFMDKTQTFNSSTGSDINI